MEHHCLAQCQLDMVLLPHYRDIFQLTVTNSITQSSYLEIILNTVVVQYVQ